MVGHIPLEDGILVRVQVRQHASFGIEGPKQVIIVMVLE